MYYAVLSTDEREEVGMSAYQSTTTKADDLSNNRETKTGTFAT